ncbi:hypothetical protein F8154_03990 [Alkaliphilus pronyensis]|uniref:Uncharacterized protein n=1 Tax=Alkaliphilus pronyensis TaxID=1482732 RepID=A0A6I0F1N0_9FIRM|nr:hypothetical protein [Alkaliphilus pronyensis]KAB3536248.1 hypothetical protein F8154_03990 [Alkaliphilus pronyensis]
MMDDKKVTVMDAIDYLTGPSPDEREIIKDIVALVGIRSFLLSLEHYDLSEPVMTKLTDLRNIAEEFVLNMVTEQKGKGGGSG